MKDTVPKFAISDVREAKPLKRIFINDLLLGVFACMVDEYFHQCLIIINLCFLESSVAFSIDTYCGFDFFCCAIHKRCQYIFPNLQILSLQAEVRDGARHC